MMMALLQSTLPPEQPRVWPKPGEKPWKVSQSLQGHTPLLRSVTCLLRHRSVSQTWVPPAKRGAISGGTSMSREAEPCLSKASVRAGHRGRACAVTESWWPEVAAKSRNVHASPAARSRGPVPYGVLTSIRPTPIKRTCCSKSCGHKRGFRDSSCFPMLKKYEETGSI